MLGGNGTRLYWLPLGAGGRSVRVNGRIFEALVAARERRCRCDLYHSALEVTVPDGRFVIEMTPVRDEHDPERVPVAGGPVGSRWGSRLRIFRYEVCRWRGGYIPDAEEAVDSPQRLTSDPGVARRALELIANVPTPVWGRDELGAGEMWNSNSLTSWVLARCGLPVASIHPPAGGRAPGWNAGLVVAGRQEKRLTDSPPRPRLRSLVDAG